MIYFSADFHWGDDRLDLLRRPFTLPQEVVGTILLNFSCITPNDTLYLLGDIALDENWIKPLRFIKGKKILIPGNYDRLSSDIYKQYFDEISESKQIEIKNDKGEILPLNLVHYPTKGIAESFNLCGHIHDVWKVQKNILNVGVDVWHYRPISEERVFFMFNGIKHFFDQDVWCSNHAANTAHQDRGKAGTYWERGFSGSNTSFSNLKPDNV